MKKNGRTVDTALLRRLAPICFAALVVSACSASGIDITAGLPEPTPASEIALSPSQNVGEAVAQTSLVNGQTQIAAEGTVPDAVAFAGPTPTDAIAVDPTATNDLAATQTAALTTPADTENAIAATTDTGVETTPQPVDSTVDGDAATARILSAANAPTASSEIANTESREASGEAEQAVQVAQAPTAALAAAPAAEPRRGLLNGLFGNRRDPARPRAIVAQAAATPQPVIQTARAEPAETPRPVIATASASGTAAGLPGFSRERALGINSDDGSSDRFDEDRPVVQLASAAGLARLAPNGLRTQHTGVDVQCLKPALVRVLKRLESHYGKPVIVTSGYRSPERNRRARGAKNSLHMYCAAADIQVPGISKWDLAAYLRSVPGRGGVGTYCHTNSVHIDIGPKRDWNWRCRRRS